MNLLDFLLLCHFIFRVAVICGWFCRLTPQSLDNLGFVLSEIFAYCCKKTKQKQTEVPFSEPEVCVPGEKMFMKMR